MSESLLTLRVARKKPEAVDICSYELVDPSGKDLPSFGAGAHIDLHLPGGMVRQYSLCNAPVERHRYLIAVLRDSKSRGGSAALHDSVGVGDFLQSSVPRNRFQLDPGARRSVLVAGGIGVTPILSMAEQLHAAGADFEMHYCTRSHERTAFGQRIANGAFAGRVALHVDTGPAEQKMDLAAVLAAPAADAHLYVCGPRPFLDLVTASARSHGWERDNIHFESFTAEQIEAQRNFPFEVQIASTGEVVAIPADRTVLAALAARGIEIPSSCEQGICGACVTGVLEGEPDHRDQYLTREEQARNDQFTPCCSRARSGRLVLDL